MRVSLWLHDQSFSRMDWIVSPLLPFRKNDVISLQIVAAPISERIYLKVGATGQQSNETLQQDIEALQSMQKHNAISIHQSLAYQIGVQTRCECEVQLVKELSGIKAQFVELVIRDYGDMFRLKRYLTDSILFKQQRIQFAGCIRATVKQVGNDASPTALVTPDTKFIFRSESAKFFIFIQVTDGGWELLIRQLRELFVKWRTAAVNHVVSIVLCGRVFYSDEFEGSVKLKQLGMFQQVEFIKRHGFKSYIDSYQVVIDWESRSEWVPMLTQVVKEMVQFKQRIMTVHPGGRLSPSHLCPLLESINLALNMFSRHYIDRDLARTGLSIVVIVEPSNGMFSVPRNLLRVCNERMIEDGVALDLICCMPDCVDAPLFQSPVFCVYPDNVDESSRHSFVEQVAAAIDTDVEPLYRDDPCGYKPFYMMPYWIDISFALKHGRTATEYPWRAQVPMQWMNQRDMEQVTVIAQGQVPSLSPNIDPDEYDRNIFGSQPSLLGKYKSDDDLILVDELSKQLGDGKKKATSLLSQQFNDHRTSAGDTVWSQQSGKIVGALNRPNLNSSPPPRSVTGAGGVSIPSSVKKQSLPQASYVDHSYQPVHVSPGNRSVHASRNELSSSWRDRSNCNLMSGGKSCDTNLSVVAKNDTEPQSFFDPCCPERSLLKMSNHIRRWHHLYPEPSQVANKDQNSGIKYLMKWTSLCSPACLPLTTDYFPSPEDLAMHFQEYTYSVSSIDDDVGDDKRPADILLMELVAQRLMQGFQLVVGLQSEKLPTKSTSRTSRGDDEDELAQPYYLSMGTQIHKLQYDSAAQNVEVKRFVRKINYSVQDVEYTCKMWPKYQSQFTIRDLKFKYPNNENYNWNYLDHVLSGYQSELTDGLRHWRSRFILIPSDSVTPQVSQYLNPSDEALTDEELRLAGFMKFLELFHKSRWSEERDAAAPAAAKKLAISNIPIAFTTFNTSTHVANEVAKWSVSNLRTGDDLASQRRISGLDRMTKDAPYITVGSALLHPTQGVLVKDRRWHLRYYEKVFIGSECVDWLIRSFADINTREEAVVYGEHLLEKGVIEHVNKKHRFLDGHYFYRLCQAYSTPEMKTDLLKNPLRWFRLPMTPTQRSVDSMVVQPSVSVDSPPFAKIELSRKIVIDLDLQRRSYRKEWAFLHYSTIHNPRNCYHFQLHWLVCTTRLVEDMLQSWSRTAQRCGLKLIEAPVEQGRVDNVNDNPFQCPIKIGLAVSPPVIDTERLQPRAIKVPDMYFELELVKHFGFILDVEADDRLDTKNITYSYTRSKYAHTQLIHKSGVAFVQVLPNARGFLWVNNRMYASQSTLPTRSSTIVQNTHQQVVEQLRVSFESLCSSTADLQKFWLDTANKLLSESGIGSLLEDITDEVAANDVSIIAAEPILEQVVQRGTQSADNSPVSDQPQKPDPISPLHQRNRSNSVTLTPVLSTATAAGEYYFTTQSQSRIVSRTKDSSDSLL